MMAIRPMKTRAHQPVSLMCVVMVSCSSVSKAVIKVRITDPITRVPNNVSERVVVMAGSAPTSQRDKRVLKSVMTAMKTRMMRV
jgi:hypothetical protein